MAQITVSTIEDKKVWEDFMDKHPEANFLHSWYWGNFHERMNHTVIRKGFFANGQLVGIVQAIVEPAKRGRHLVVPGGPILDWDNTDLVKAWVANIKIIASENKCLFVRVRPQLLDEEDNRRLFKQLGFHRSPMHVTADLTSQIDLTKSDEELKKAMRKGTRYELNQAEKLGIVVEETTDTSFIDKFCELQFETAKRQNFVPFSRKFLTEQFAAFQEPNKVVMYRSLYKGKLLAMAFIIFYGSEAAYHYGASTDLARQYPGAYAIQAQAMKEARKRGCTRYNMWGVAEHGQTQHRFYGVSVFKRGFGGEDVAYLPAHDLIVNPLFYPLTYSFETARRKLRKL
jgi:lipid II:glycine glycyltransferase (peptidoglycan interpeptide bridge formation enzyme)